MSWQVGGVIQIFLETQRFSQPRASLEGYVLITLTKYSFGSVKKMGSTEGPLFYLSIFSFPGIWEAWLWLCHSSCAWLWIAFSLLEPQYLILRSWGQGWIRWELSPTSLDISGICRRPSLFRSGKLSLHLVSTNRKIEWTLGWCWGCLLIFALFLQDNSILQIFIECLPESGGASLMAQR